MIRLNLFLFVVLTCIGTTSRGQISDIDSFMLKKRISVGLGVLSGTNYVLELPDGAEFNTGGHFGGAVQMGYRIHKKVSISSDIRYIQGNQVIDLNNQIDPDLFMINSSSLQFPLIIHYEVGTHKQKPLLGIGVGIGYQLNEYRVKYRNFMPRYPGVPLSEAKRDVMSKDEDWFVLFNLNKSFHIIKNQASGITLFFEYQQNFGSSSFKNKVVDYEYTLVVKNDIFTSIFFRFGCYLKLYL